MALRKQAGAQCTRRCGVHQELPSAVLLHDVCGRCGHVVGAEATSALTGRDLSERP